MLQFNIFKAFEKSENDLYDNAQTTSTRFLDGCEHLNFVTKGIMRLSLLVLEHRKSLLD